MRYSWVQCQSWAFLGVPSTEKGFEIFCSFFSLCSTARRHCFLLSNPGICKVFTYHVSINLNLFECLIVQYIFSYLKETWKRKSWQWVNRISPIQLTLLSLFLKMNLRDTNMESHICAWQQDAWYSLRKSEKYGQIIAHWAAQLEDKMNLISHQHLEMFHHQKQDPIPWEFSRKD